MPTRFTVTFELADPASVLPSGLHKFTCQLLDPSHGETDQEHEEPRPFSITPLRRLDDLHWEYDIVILPDLPEAAELEEALAQRLGPYRNGTPYRFGHSEAWLTNAMAPVRWDRTASWEALSETPATDVIALAFCTPVLSRARNRHNQLPNLRTLLQGVAKKWNTFGASTCPSVDLSAEEIAISQMDVRLLPYQTAAKAGPQTGLVGRLVLDLRNCSARGRKAISALVAASESTGVGSSSTYGMGVVRRIFSDRPAPTYYWNTEGEWNGRRNRFLVGCAGGVPCTPLPGELPLDLKPYTGWTRQMEGSAHR